jgi:hypothetical protein
MLPFTGIRKIHISNRLAIFAAVLLVVTSLADFGNSGAFRDEQTVVDKTTMVAEETSSLMNSGGTAQVKKNSGFKMSLFLFRNN